MSRSLRIAPGAASSPESPQVSVLVPVRNAARWLRHALGDLLAEQSVTLEIVAVDDHSTDRSAEVLAAFATADPRVRVVKARGRGIAAALEAALGESRAPWIGVMEADDRCHPDRFAWLTRSLAAHPGWDGVVSRTTLLGARSNGMDRYLAWQNALLEPGDLARERFVEIPALLQTGLFARALIERVGGFREPPSWPTDIDFWMRVFASGARIGRVPRKLYRWRQHPRQDTRTSERHGLEAIQRCKAHYFVCGPARGRAIDLVSVGRTLATWESLLAAEGATDVRAIAWKPSMRDAPARRDGAVRVFVYGMRPVREQIRARISTWDDALDWFAA